MRGLTTTNCKNQIMLGNITHSLGPRRIIWHDTSPEEWMRFGTCNVRPLYGRFIENGSIGISEV
jgi:hypothetical protein